jgi:hypothetical protein
LSIFGYFAIRELIDGLVDVLIEWEIILVVFELS